MPRLIAIALSACLALVVAPTAHAGDVIEPGPAAGQSTLRWTDCESKALVAAQCAWLTVPRDWSRPETGTYRIAVARIPARAQASRGTLVFNPGGPGGSGLDALSGVHSGLPRSVQDSFDVVSFDPRAVGASQPHLAPCRTIPPDLPATGPVDWTTVATDFLAASAAANAACLELNADHAGNIGTWQVVRDVNALRRALGQKQITFWGMSYGTTLGRAFAQRFPERVRALLLDGTITPTPTIGGYAREHIWDDATALQTMLGAFDARTRRSYRDVMAFLDTNTIATPQGDVITRWDVSNKFTGSAAYQGQWDDVEETILLLDAVTEGERTAPTPEVTDWLEEPVERLRGEEQQGDPAYTFINCSDMHDRPDADVLIRAAEQAAAVGGTTLGMPALVEGAQCAGLPPLGTAIPPMRGTLRLATPPVIVNSVADNRTPWLGARSTANAFAGASMVTYDGAQHVVYTGPSACVDEAVTPYLLDRILPSRSVACPLVLPRALRTGG